MFVGNGMFVHAASSKRGVVLDPLDLPYYASKYAGARRYK
jgi:cell wall-associated NlpC family hydrolase